MTPPAFAAPDAFSTYSLRSAEPVGRDMALLQSHVAQCGQQRRRWSDVKMKAAAVHHFLAPRFATTLTLMLVVIVGVSMAV